jgi:magnesium-transporting ATPase (P-type)
MIKLHTKLEEESSSYYAIIRFIFFLFLYCSIRIIVMSWFVRMRLFINYGALTHCNVLFSIEMLRPRFYIGSA